MQRVGHRRSIEAAVLRGEGEPFSIETLEIREPHADEVLVRVLGAGICHSDVSATSRMDMPHPVVLGHEGSGVVEDVGPDVVGLAVGDHVIMTFSSCGCCHQCLLAQPAYCEMFSVLNLSCFDVDGTSPIREATTGQVIAGRWFGQSSFASFSLVRERNAIKAPAELPIEILGPLGCGFQTGAGAILNSLRLAPGESIVVFGAGAVGLAAVMAAKIAGAMDIVAVDIRQERLNLAEECGATKTVAGDDPDLESVLKAIACFEYAFDTTGQPSVVNVGLRSLRSRGTLGIVGGGLGPELDQFALFGKRVISIIEGDSVPALFIPRLISLWKKGLFPFEKLLRSYPLSAINTAVADTLSGDVVKPVLVPYSFPQQGVTGVPHYVREGNQI